MDWNCSFSTKPPRQQKARKPFDFRAFLLLRLFVVFHVSDKHSVAKRKESITLLNGHFICGHRLFVAIEGRHQHDEGAFGQMEVGDEAVDAVELDTRIEEDVGVAAAGFDLAVLGGDGFQRAAAGGAYGDDLVARSFGVMD